MSTHTGDIRQLDLTNEQKFRFLKGIENLRFYNQNSGIIQGVLEKELLTRFESIVGFFPFKKETTCFENEFTRIVVNRLVREDNKNARLESIEQVKYPPQRLKHKIGYNRANLKQQPVFYATCGTLSSALETKPKFGDLLTVTKWKQKRGTSVSYLSFFHKPEVAAATDELTEQWNIFTEHTEQMKPSVREVFREQYNFITEAFSQVVGAETRIRYIFSALFANYYFYNKDTLIDCIVYPSVPSDYIAHNIAMKPEVLEEKFEIIDLHESFCNYHGPNQRQWLDYRTAKAVAPSLGNNFIVWEDETIYDNAVLENMRRNIEKI